VAEEAAKNAGEVPPQLYLRGIVALSFPSSCVVSLQVLDFLSSLQGPHSQPPAQALPEPQVHRGGDVSGALSHCRPHR
jgi:hypothetical protein